MTSQSIKASTSGVVVYREHATTSHIEQMCTLVADLDSQHRRERLAFDAGYRAGFEAGDEVGYGRRCHEEHEMWAALAAKIRGQANTPTHAELTKRRSEPGGDVYLAAYTRRGGDYLPSNREVE